MGGDPAVEATGLVKSYGDVRVLEGIDLRVERGGVFALLGPNGAGKTTSIRILATLIRPDAGQAKVAGFDVVRDRGQVRRAISLTGQYAALDAMQTGEENLSMMGRLYGLSGRRARDRAGVLLERFGLGEARNRRVATYSGGMRRRLDLAAGLVGEPAVIFLDEPTTGLDVRSRQAMWDLVGELTSSGVTVFLTTQYLEEADRLADHVAVLDAGRVVADGTPAELKQRIGEHRLDLTMADPAAYDELLAMLGTRAVASDRDRLRLGVPTDGTAVDIRGLLDELDPSRRAIRSFAVHTSTLDDVFLTLTGHKAVYENEKEPAHV